LRNKKTGETIQTQDPGLAMTTGLWEDIGRFKIPVLRGLSTRAPYFHDGSAKTIEDVTNFYNKQFHIGFTAQELADLNAFLKAL
jgi:cytochrome c peroxidase